LKNNVIVLASIATNWNSSWKALVMHALSYLLIIVVFMAFTSIHVQYN
jgi:hypothetical protein